MVSQFLLQSDLEASLLNTPCFVYKAQILFQMSKTDRDHAVALNNIREHLENHLKQKMKQGSRSASRSRLFPGIVFVVVLKDEFSTSLRPALR